jgi:dienelactone hydrolase
MIGASALSATTVSAGPVEDALVNGATKVPAIELPRVPVDDPAKIPANTSLAKPAGPGPFPAVVIQTTCGGWTEDIRTWARTAIAQGYVALVVDTVKARGRCGPQATHHVFARDALTGLAHLKTLDFVDPARIAHLGVSVGAISGYLVASKTITEKYVAGKKFNAVAALYGSCQWTFKIPSVPERETLQYVRADWHTPVLALLGGKDPEATEAECVPEFEKARAAGKMVEWHVYPSAGHCFDCRHESGRKVRSNRGVTMDFYYDKAAHEDAIRRIFDFFGRQMRPDS